MPSPPVLHLIACLAAVVTAAGAAAGAVLVRGSTAVPAALWAVAAGLALAAEMGCAAAGGLADPAVRAAARLAVVALALCPAMSLLGAKRPQHGVWQFIVATLGVVLAMPAVSAALVRPGTLPDVHLLGRCFMLVLAIVGWLNFVATRHSLAATLVTAGQLVLLRPFLPLAATAEAFAAPAVDSAACLLAAAGAALAAVQSALAPARIAAGTGHPVAARIDPVYLAVRETLGAAWTLRIAERFDAVAASRGWPCRLGFAGIRAGGDAADTAWHRDAVRVFRSLVRRFVSDDWLQRRGWQ
jgi:hypothetical protein